MLDDNNACIAFIRLTQYVDRCLKTSLTSAVTLNALLVGKGKICGTGYMIHR